MEETITKRLHVSGLTPAITPADLSRRLGSFGTVTALDGFGLVDAVGQPRKFGYVTLETTKPRLAQCMSLLSGVTWKGAKLRIGEAKPDYRERIASEQATMKRSASTEDEPPRKRRRLPRGVQGVYARDMSPVTPQNAASRAGWHVTPLGRLVRPIRIRPDRPLPEPIPLAVKIAKKTKDAKEKGKTRKKRAKDPPTRARRRTIDPTKWGSQLLTGAFLEGGVLRVDEDARAVRPAQPQISESGNEEESEEAPDDIEPEDEDFRHVAPEVTPASLRVPIAPAHPPVQKGRAAVPSDGHDLEQEKHQTLGLLQAMFGDREDGEWGGEESVGSDVELDVQGRTSPLEAEESEEDAPLMDVDKPQTQTKKLKDIFAPREEDTGFSLLEHLDLDLELDDEVDFDIAAQSQATAVPEPAASKSSIFPTFDAKRALFFPAPSDRIRDALDPTDWRKWFFRTDSTEDIQTRWEETRGELTSGWKRRHREAVKSRRRRGGGVGEET